MRKLWYILKKESLLLVRDIPGLIILFLMPVLLIFVVTLAQENALRVHVKTPVLFVDELKSPFSANLSANLDSSGFFHIVRKIDGHPVSISQAEKLIGLGDYKFGVRFIHPDSAIVLLMDPALQESYKTAVRNSLVYIIKGTQANAAMDEILGFIPGEMQAAVGSMVADKMRNLPPVREIYAQKEPSAIKPGVIQNNVPGFILFAMFFIVIPLAGSLITEKTDGSFLRLRSLPVGFSLILGGKVLTYLVVCLVQFALMMAIGIWIFPAFFGFPPLELGNRYFAIAVATVAASLAAVGFGTIVGALSTTHNQAALFGSVMVVLLGVVSGTFLPIHIMPEFIQYISYLSPIRWGIDNYLTLFVREGNLVSILPNTLLLCLFFGLAMTSSIAIFAKQN